MSFRESFEDFSARLVQKTFMKGAFAYEKLNTGFVYDPTSRAHLENPYPGYSKLRTRDPMHRSVLAGGLVLSRYQDCVDLLRDSRFSVDARNNSRYPTMRRGLERAGGDVSRLDHPSMLQSDPPEHTRLRALVSKAFTPRAIESLESRIVAIAEELLGAVDDSDPFDVIAAYSHPLPIIVIAEMLGVPPEDRDRFRFWSDEVVLALGLAAPSEIRRSTRAMAELDAYFKAIIDERRREPRDDLVSAMIRAEEDGYRLSQRELLATCTLLLVAGNETTAHLIGNGLLALLRNPEQLELLRSDPSLWGTAVDELLRYDPPIQLTVRAALEDLEFNGEPLSKGAGCVVLLASGNRDPGVFADPDRLDITRRENPHLSLGHGRHVCLGAALARLEARIALRTILEHYPKLQLVDAKPSWGSNTVIRGLTKLPVRTG